ncbi:MAG: glycerate kinase [Rhodoglobus sp.]
MPPLRRPLIVIAPDSFKGSLSAPLAADALTRGVHRALAVAHGTDAHSPDAHNLDAVSVLTFAMADGGEGSLDAVHSAQPSTLRLLAVPTVDAIGRRRRAHYGFDSVSGHAVIEASQANGLPHVSDVALQPLRADSYGVGIIAADAIARGARTITLFLGGSASTDGGSGLLRALGARFLAADGSELSPGGAPLGHLATVDLSGLNPGARETTWHIAVDVTNPLIGAQGAAHIFGMQKGATVSDCAVLDAGLTRLGQVLTRTESGVSRSPSFAALTALPGLGAAGGIATVLMSLGTAQLLPGAKLVADAIGLSAVVPDADLIISGEGRLDTQSLEGKVVDYLSAAKSPAAQLVVIAGSVTLSAQQLAAAGIDAAFTLGVGGETHQELYERSAELLEARAFQVCTAWLARTPDADRSNARDASGA